MASSIARVIGPTPPGIGARYPATSATSGATVLSVGITRTSEGILGDVHPEVDAVAGKVSPAIGGVGPMTRAMLLTNIVEIAERSLLVVTANGDRRVEALEVFR